MAESKILLSSVISKLNPIVNMGIAIKIIENMFIATVAGSISINSIFSGSTLNCASLINSLIAKIQSFSRVPSIFIFIFFTSF